ncbi:hypothetical protein K488DRAFT_74377 [Vararia minispora EC-137]|uniref:Uncharacterized protein n=1 Tax=Vararia minispora EC-137 TaxID=1314806 RepID=A0ACB8Q7V3_9AGAM|nr:hypothetical protein K488DRAFT_74377 [Vararia minispora EC-137]
MHASVAICSRTVVVTMILYGVWLASTVLDARGPFLVRKVRFTLLKVTWRPVQARAVYVPSLRFCGALKTNELIANDTGVLALDVLLLSVILDLLRRQESRRAAQGIAWLVIASAAEILAVVLTVLNLSGTFSRCPIPSSIFLPGFRGICASHMYRTLTDHGPVTTFRRTVRVAEFRIRARASKGKDGGAKEFEERRCSFRHTPRGVSSRHLVPAPGGGSRPQPSLSGRIRGTLTRAFRSVNLSVRSHVN